MGQTDLTAYRSAENADKAFFCSELVARCIELTGAPIVEGSASLAAPRAIRRAARYRGRSRTQPAAYNLVRLSRLVPAA